MQCFYNPDGTLECIEYAESEIVPLPARCLTCGRTAQIEAPSLAMCRCFWCPATKRDGHLEAVPDQIADEVVWQSARAAADLNDTFLIGTRRWIVTRRASALFVCAEVVPLATETCLPLPPEAKARLVPPSLFNPGWLLVTAHLAHVMPLVSDYQI